MYKIPNLYKRYKFSFTKEKSLFSHRNWAFILWKSYAYVSKIINLYHCKSSFQFLYVLYMAYNKLVCANFWMKQKKEVLYLCLNEIVMVQCILCTIRSYIVQKCPQFLLYQRTKKKKNRNKRKMCQIKLGWRFSLMLNRKYSLTRKNSIKIHHVKKIFQSISACSTEAHTHTHTQRGTKNKKGKRENWRRERKWNEGKRQNTIVQRHLISCTRHLLPLSPPHRNIQMSYF